MADVGLHAVRNVDSPLYYTDFVSFVLRRIFQSQSVSEGVSQSVSQGQADL